MSRRSSAVTSGGVQYVPIHEPLGPSDRYLAMYGHDRASSPVGMRKLTVDEQAHGCVWSWSPEHATYVCDHFPSGMPT